MLRMAKDKSTEYAASINFLGNGTSIAGDVLTSGDFRIDGQLKGSIKSKGKLVIGSSGFVEGDIVCQNADISGTVKARLVTAELLTLKSTAKIYGDIITGKLAIEPGAVFTGTCKMGDAPGEDIPVQTKNENVQKKEEAIR
jgi:cytoskeletal protein CcmA (bactofilin family)